MDTRTHERGRPPLHGVVIRSRPTPARAAARRGGGPWAPLLLALVATALLAGLAGGLLRLGIAPPAAVHGDWVGRAGLHHAALMICAFMGTVIGIERAVAVKHGAAWLAPLLAGAAGATLLLGADSVARGLLVVASVVFVGVNVVVVRRQREAHSLLLLASAGAWLAGNLLFAAGAPGGAVLPWWFGFLVVTIAAERLEMTRLMRRRPAAQPALYGVLALLALGAAASAIRPGAGGVLYGVALVALALWLLVFDIARRTVRAQALPRYMAVCLLGGYLWLAIAGVAWAATALGWPARDLALHALGLGFIVSMMMGHAPVILPAVARVKLLFGAFFYLPLAALHASLVVRFLPGWFDLSWRAGGGLFNVLAIALFAVTVIGAALAWRHKYRVQDRTQRAHP